MDVYCIKNGIFPYHKSNLIKPPPNAPRFDILPQEIQRLFIRCFVDGMQSPSKRPTIDEWKNTLERTESLLINCNNNKDHIYYQHAQGCPWCQKKAQSLSHVRPSSGDMTVFEKISFVFNKICHAIKIAYNLTKELAINIYYMLYGFFASFLEALDFLQGYVCSFIAVFVIGIIIEYILKINISLYLYILFSGVCALHCASEASEETLSTIQDDKHKKYFCSGACLWVTFVCFISYKAYKLISSF